MHPALALLRPKQWTKNLLVAAPLFFAGLAGNAGAWLHILLAIVAFICLSSIAYIFNDINDVKEDRLHPIKSKRPIAEHTITIKQALRLAAILAAFGFFLFLFLPIECLQVAIAYSVLNIIYSKWLKHMAIYDSLCIGIFYVMRVVMGCYVLQVVASPWIIMTTFFLAIFLGLGKRYHEINLPGYGDQKRNLAGYSPKLLEYLIIVTAGASLVTYAIYAAEIAISHQANAMAYTILFVCFGLFRYMQSVFVKNQGGEPENMLLRDKVQIANLLLWLICVLAIIA